MQLGPLTKLTILAVGASVDGSDTQAGHGLAEIYGLTTQKWQSIEPYPYVGTGLFEGYIYAQPVIHVDSAFYVFGGKTGSMTYTNVIGRLDAVRFVWSQAGTMKRSRGDHNVIHVDRAFLVIGGYDERGEGNYATEKCQLNSNGTTMSCSIQEPTLDYHYKWPELILVEDDFCKELP